MAGIELVIKIDEDYYEIIKHGVEHGSDYKPWTLIAHGTPLPKGHDDLIERKDVLNEIIRFSTEEGASVECSQLYCDVNNQPPIIEANKAESEVRE